MTALSLAVSALGVVVLCLLDSRRVGGAFWLGAWCWIGTLIVFDLLMVAMPVAASHMLQSELGLPSLGWLAAPGAAAALRLANSSRWNLPLRGFILQRTNEIGRARQTHSLVTELIPALEAMGRPTVVLLAEVSVADAIRSGQRRLRSSTSRTTPSMPLSDMPIEEIVRYVLDFGRVNDLYEFVGRGTADGAELALLPTRVDAASPHQNIREGTAS